MHCTRLSDPCISVAAVAGANRRCSTLALVLLGVLFAAAPLAHGQTCPSYGYDTDCGTIITITDTGAVITVTGQGPYDGNDDTMVGVVNQSKLPVHALALQSIYGIFGFDGDGLVGYGAPGNAMDPTGYGGPNAYFTNINASQTAGVVNFINPIPPGGGIAYFSLENALSSAVSCQDVVNGGLHAPPPGPVGSANIDASFTPQLGYSLQQAAPFCGFVNFDWVQNIVHQDDPSMFYARNLAGAFNPGITGPVQLSSGTTPYSDPPQGGGYTYTTSPDYSYPFYYDIHGELLTHETGGYTLQFHDAPGDGCLPGGVQAGTAVCSNTSEPAGSYGGYSNHLNGVNADGTATDLGIGFDYTSNYNGTAGGVFVKKTNAPADNNGTGIATVTNVTENTNYQYNGFTVTAVNGGSASQSIYVADSWRVQQFTSAGVYVSQFPINAAGRFFFGPAGLAVDGSGNVFLTDTYNKNVTEFDATGNFLRSFGSYGSDPGQFQNGIGNLAFDTTGNLLVVDYGNNRIERFSPTGAFIDQIGTTGNGDGQFKGPVGVAVDGMGDILVADSYRVQKFTAAGSFLSQFRIDQGGRFLFGPGGLTLDAAGNLYLTDTANKNVVEFDANGNFLQSFGSYGSGNGQFLNGIGNLGVTSSGDVLVTDSGNGRVEDFDKNGVYQNQFGTIGKGGGQFDGHVVVAIH